MQPNRSGDRHRDHDAVVDRFHLAEVCILDSKRLDEQEPCVVGLIVEEDRDRRTSGRLDGRRVVVGRRTLRPDAKPRGSTQGSRPDTTVAMANP